MKAENENDAHRYKRVIDFEFNSVIDFVIGSSFVYLLSPQNEVFGIDLQEI
jgi:hypothetical protein